MKKFLAIILAGVMMLALALPVMASGETIITRIAATGAGPSVGETASSLYFIITTYDENDTGDWYAVDESHKCYVDNNGSWEEFTGTFERGKDYKLEITLTAKSGNLFSSNPAPTFALNGEACSTTLGGDNTTVKATILYSFPAAKYTITATNDGNGSCGVTETSVAQGTQVSVNTKPKAGYELAEIVLTRDTSGESVILEGNTFEMPAEDVTVKANFIPEGHKLTRVDVNVEAIIGKKVYSTFPTTDTAGVSIDEASWYKLPTGGSIERDATKVEEDEVFETGYTYALQVSIDVDDDYRFADKDTTLYMNGEEIAEAKGGKDLAGVGIVIPKEEEPTTEEPTTEEPTTEEPTTEAPTEEPTTEEPSDNPKTGDAGNMWLYCLAGVIALGAMGAVVLKKKADR